MYDFRKCFPLVFLYNSLMFLCNRNSHNINNYNTLLKTVSKGNRNEL